MKTNVELAREDDPEGSFCGFCGQENDLADDVGWFYASIEPFNSPMPNCHGVPVCKSCWDGMVGVLNTELHGCGDR